MPPAAQCTTQHGMRSLSLPAPRRCSHPHWSFWHSLERFPPCACLEGSGHRHDQGSDVARAPQSVPASVKTAGSVTWVFECASPSSPLNIPRRGSALGNAPCAPAVADSNVPLGATSLACCVHCGCFVCVVERFGAGGEGRAMSSLGSGMSLGQPGPRRRGGIHVPSAQTPLVSVCVRVCSVALWGARCRASE